MKRLLLVIAFGAVTLTAPVSHAQTIVQNQTNTGAGSMSGYQTGTGNYVFIGDTFSGGPGTNPTTFPEAPGSGLVVAQASSAMIESGTYTGGNGAVPYGFTIAGGAGLNINTALPVTIAGGTFILLPT